MAKEEKSYNDLKKEAKKLGMKVKVGVNKIELIALIKAAKKVKKEKPETTKSTTEAPVEEKVTESCPDCTLTVNEGGKSQFTGKGGVKPGLLDEKTICPTCEGRGTI